MGYEPLPPVQGRTLFGKEAMFYPNMFKYCTRNSSLFRYCEQILNCNLGLCFSSVMHIKSVDGFLGLYRGFGCALTAKLVSWYTTTQVEKVREK